MNFKFENNNFSIKIFNNRKITSNELSNEEFLRLRKS